SARPYPVMLLIARCKSLCQRSAQHSTPNLLALRRVTVASTLRANESLHCAAMRRGHCDALDRFEPTLVCGAFFWNLPTAYHELPPVMREWKKRGVNWPNMCRYRSEWWQNPHATPAGR